MIANVCLCLRFSRNVGPFYSLKPASNARHANENRSKCRERECLCLCASAIIHASMKTYVIAKWKKNHHAFCHQLRITYIKCSFIKITTTPRIVYIKPYSFKILQILVLYFQQMEPQPFRHYYNWYNSYKFTFRSVTFYVNLFLRLSVSLSFFAYTLYLIFSSTNSCIQIQGCIK